MSENAQIGVQYLLYSFKDMKASLNLLTILIVFCLLCSFISIIFIVILFFNFSKHYNVNHGNHANEIEIKKEHKETFINNQKVKYPKANPIPVNNKTKEQTSCCNQYCNNDYNIDNVYGHDSTPLSK